MWYVGCTPHRQTAWVGQTTAPLCGSDNGALFLSEGVEGDDRNVTHPLGADWLGYLAAMLVFCSFYARTIVVLRVVAITSNMAFIGYAVAKGLYPVLILHVVLLPLNCVRLAQLRAMTKRLKRGNNH